MATNQVWAARAAAGIAAAAALCAAGLAGTTDHLSGELARGAQLAAGVVASATCWWTGRQASGVERRWRLLMALGMSGWSAGQAVSVALRAAGGRLHSPSAADLGYFALPVFALAALLVFARAGGVPGAGTVAHSPVRHWSRAVLTLDGLVVVASLFVIAWATALGATVRAGAPTVGEFVVAIGYPASDLILVVIVVLLVALHQTARPYRMQLTFVGLGLIALSI